MQDLKIIDEIVAGLTSSLPALYEGQRSFKVRLQDERILIEIESDGLTLAQKLELEKDVRSLAGQWVPETRDLLVNFRRKSSKEPLRALASEARVFKPLGVSREPRAIPLVKDVVVVGSGKGGVGKSTVSTNLAVGMARLGWRVGLLDADIYGPSAPLMLGEAGPLGVSPDQKLIPRMAHGVKVVSFGFFTGADHPVIWRGPLVAKAMKQLLYDVEWGELDCLVVDLPPGTGDVQLTMVESLPISGAVIVTTPQDVALLDARKAVSMFREMEVPILGVVENMAYHVCKGCGHKEAIFGELSDEQLLQWQLPKLARIPLNATVRLQADSGYPSVLGESEAGQIFLSLARLTSESLHLETKSS